MVGSRRCALVLAAFACLIVVSVPFMHFDAARYAHPLKGLLTPKQAPPANRVPSLDQRILHGASNVWEDTDHIVESQWRENQALKSAAHDVFLLLKTGAETMWNRVPVHFDTTLQRFPYNAIYSDMGALLNTYDVVDILQYLPAWALNSGPLLGYRIHRTSIDDHWGWGPSKLALEGEGAGWQTDRYKNIPAFVHAWQLTNGEMPWYLMIDGDTYIVTSTLSAAIENRNPDDIWYLGHGVGLNPIFAHGGSGILLSRGAMRAMFREPNNTEWHRELIDDACQRAIPDCCGDSIVAYEFERLTGLPAETNLELEENGMFQGNPKAVMRLNPKMWCTPVGSFHHVSSWEIQQLYNWEDLAMARKAHKGDYSHLTYADFYEDFVEPFIVEQRANWYFEEANMALSAIVYTPESPGDIWHDNAKLDLLGNVNHCRQACVLEETCLAWEWRQNIKCRIFINEFSLGLALNPYSPNWKEGTMDIAAGHMVDRIDAIHRNAPCRQSNSTDTNTTVTTKPGWYIAAIHEEAIDGKLVHDLESRPLLREEMAIKPNLTLTSGA